MHGFHTVPFINIVQDFFPGGASTIITQDYDLHLQHTKRHLSLSLSLSLSLLVSLSLCLCLSLSVSVSLSLSLTALNKRINVENWQKIENKDITTVNASLFLLVCQLPLLKLEKTLHNLLFLLLI